MEYSTDAVLIEFLTTGGADAAIVEIPDNVCCYFTGSISVENLTDDSCLIFIDVELSILVNFVAKPWIATVRKTLFGIELHTTIDLLDKLNRIVLGRTFQNTFDENTRSIVCDVLFGGEDTDAILFQLCLMDGAVIPVSGKTIQLIDQYKLDCFLFAILNHPLEAFTIIRCSALCSIYILSDYCIIVGFGIFITNTQLTFNRLFSLTVAGEPRIDNNIYFKTSCFVLSTYITRFRVSNCNEM